MAKKLSGYGCKGCGLAIWAPQAYCPGCGKDQWDDLALPETGELVTFTEIFTAPARFEKETPYMIGIARLSEGVNVIGRIEGAKINDLSVGLPVLIEMTETDRIRITPAL